MMTENKLEETIDLLAEYGGFNREYLRDKLLTFANDGRSETKNKWKSISVNIMDEVAALKGKELNEPFMVESNVHKVAKQVRFTERGMEYFDESCQRWYPTDGFLKEILTGDAVIVSNE